MRLLFEIDTKDYNADAKKFVRPSARAIIIKNGKLAMVHSIKYNYYKLPGGGINVDETNEQALIRETREEAGLVVMPCSIKSYGYVHRVQKGIDNDIFVQDSFYYFCTAEETPTGQHLDPYENEERFTLEYISPQEAIMVNAEQEHGPKSKVMLQREITLLQMLLAEGYVK